MGDLSRNRVAATVRTVLTVLRRFFTGAVGALPTDFQFS